MFALDSAASDISSDLPLDILGSISELVFVFDDCGRLRWCNQRAVDQLGTSCSSLLGRHGSELVHPDDVALGLELFVSARATGPGVKEPVVYRLGTPTSGWEAFDCVATVIERSDGRSQFVVTGRRHGLQRSPDAIFDEASSRVSAMFDQSLIGLAQFSLNRCVLRANRRFAALLGHSDPHSLTGKRVLDDLEGAAALLDSEGAEIPALHIPTTTPAADLSVDRRTGAGIAASYTTTHISSSLVRDHRGDPMYYALQAVDITALHRTQEALRARCRELDEARQRLTRLVVQDALTGLLNRRGLDQWSTTNDPAWAAYIDVVDFKAINDSFGHACGDEVLIEVASRLRIGTRRADCVARLGGDEFALIGTSPSYAFDPTAVERRIHRLFERPIITASGSFRVAVRIGVAHVGPGDTIWTALETADRALYQNATSTRTRRRDVDRTTRA
jgi:diguanylate cyclase (GGDEF)-like protein